MKRLVVISLLAVTLMLLCLVGHATSPSEFQETLFATSNAWGTVISSYEAVVTSAVVTMPPSEESRAALVEWYGRLASYDETAGQSRSGEWAFEKGRMLHKFARNQVIANSTNAWMSAAGCLGRMKHQKHLLDSSMRDAISLTNLADRVSSEWNAIIGEQLDSAFAISNLRIGIGKAMPLIEEVVTNGFPRAILPALEGSTRHTLVSNVAEAAGIDISVVWTLQDR